MNENLPVFNFVFEELGKPNGKPETTTNGIVYNLGETSLFYQKKNFDVNNIPDENYISPEVIQAEMLAAGFSTHVYPWFGFFSLGRILRSIASLLPFVFFRQIVESITFYGVKD